MTDLLRAACLLLALVLASCGHPAPWNARLDPALAKLIPADATMLLDVNLARLRGTPVYQKHFSQLAGRQLADFTLRTGIDPGRDIDQLLLASDGKNIVMLVRGRFNPGDAAAKLQAAGATRTRYDDTDLFAEHGNDIVFLDSATAAAGAEAGVRSVLDQRRNGGGGIPAALQPVVEAIPSKDQIWAVLIGGVPAFPAEGNLRNLVELARTVDQASAGLDLQNGLDLQARADCRSPEDARRLHDALRGVIALARMSTPANRPDLVKVYDAINVVRENLQVRLTASLSQQELDSFLSLLSKPR